MMKRVLLASVTILLYALYAALLFTLGGYVGIDGAAIVYLSAHPLLLCGFGLLLGALLIYQMYWPHRKPLVLTRQTYEKRKRAGGILLLLAARLALGALGNMFGIFTAGVLIAQVIAAVSCALCILTLILLFGHKAFPGVYIGFIFYNIALAIYPQEYVTAGATATLEAAVIIYLFLSENVSVLYRTRPLDIIEPEETAQPDDEAVETAPASEELP